MRVTRARWCGIEHVTLPKVLRIFTNDLGLLYKSQIWLVNSANFPSVLDITGFE